MGNPIGKPIGRPNVDSDVPSTVLTVATAQLNGRPVVVFGGNFGSVGVWDLASGDLIGNPIQTDKIQSALTTAELDGHPVIIIGDVAVQVCDLATGNSIGEPFVGHANGVAAVATAQFDGRPVVVSGSYDYTIRTWNLAARVAS